MPSKNTPHRPAAIDPLVAQRLEALNRRQGQSLPPPVATAAGARAAGPKAAGATPRAGRRAKPARKAKAASVALSVVTTGALAALFSQQDPASDSVVLTSGTLAPLQPTAVTTTPVVAPIVTTPIVTTPQTPVTQTPVTQAPVTQAPAAATVADGTYLGQPSQNRWGVVQVQAVYSGGQLADVQVLRYPDGDRRSLRISQYSLPRLVDQALSAQGTAISGISGATYTSRSYVASLQSAIDAAKAASGVTG
ncbi:MAG: hypothetical protein RI900_3276 [Actinomycetota bacterium]|jgi:uncharacterized protein with FMN-binding domain